ncbi:hypothetical protein [Streptomyces sp. AM8-1-1]|uniref:hypothetical protein n=1 Tax=Streptomyces sp. AM8-1-1 TaxID=3075825 RepID=UPI0028C50755|nr:hypothetical protein [Streptomyces sp. AM8-1-1]WNO71205.1 hypothetical protein RPQ07_06015 [Streptomyces sp. AM8-1-1]
MTRTGRRFAEQRGRVVSGTAAVLAVVFCAVSAWAYGQARGDDSLAHATSRDEVLSDGKEHIVRLTSFDAEDPAAGRRQWLDASTGPLHDELKRVKARKGATARTARATVTDAALTALDKRAGTAELIATVRVERAPGAGAAAGATAGSERKRLEAVLARTPDGWKVQSLSAVPVGGA